MKEIPDNVIRTLFKFIPLLASILGLLILAAVLAALSAPASAQTVEADIDRYITEQGGTSVTIDNYDRVIRMSPVALAEYDRAQERRARRAVSAADKRYYRTACNALAGTGSDMAWNCAKAGVKASAAARDYAKEQLREAQNDLGDGVQ